MTKVQSKNAILFDIGNDDGPLREAMVDTIGEGTAVEPGLISAIDKAKLDGIAAGATANATDAVLRDRTTHTGEQAIGTITGLVDALAGKATPADVAAALAGLVDSSPATLDTLNELAAALGDDPAFATTVSTALGNRLRVDAAQGLTVPQQAQGRDNLGLGSAALAASGDFATAAQGAKADQLPAGLTPSGMLASAADGLSSIWLAFHDARQALDLAFVENYSMPLALSFYTIQISDIAGSDDTGGNLLHGQSGQTPFKTSDAAILHAKKYLRFTGRLNVVRFEYANDKDVWNFNIGSNLVQGDEGFPFAIYIASINDADRAKFDSITTGNWLSGTLYVTQVELAYVGGTRLNTIRVNDVTIRSRRDGSNNPISSPYCFYSAIGSFLHVFGDILVKEAVTYTTAFMYAQVFGRIMLENGDSPTVFPAVEILNPGHITSPSKYRAVNGGFVYAPYYVYPQMTYASTYHVDAVSASTQTVLAQDLNLNTGVGGAVVARGGTDTSGWEKYADGKCKQWGVLAVTSAAVGVSSPASAALTYPIPFSASSRIRYNVGLSTVIVSNPGPGATGVQFVVNNLGAASASFNIFWEASGSL